MSISKSPRPGFDQRWAATDGGHSCLAAVPRSRPSPVMRRVAAMTVLASVPVLMAGACNGLRLPALPAKATQATPVDSQAKSQAAPRVNRAMKRSAKADPALDGQRFDELRRGLRRLVVTEENYYAETGAYTDGLSRIGFAPEGGAKVRFLWLTRSGWAASATHPAMAGKDCVVYVGRGHGAPTTLRDVRSGREGVPVCDGPPARHAPAPASAAPVTPPPVPAGVAPVTVPSVASAALDTGSALDAVGPSVQMRVDLRNLVRSQDTYFRLQGVYAKRSEPFALQFLWHRGVTVTILSADDASWSARATHASRPGKSCVIWLGPVAERPATLAQKRVPGQPAVPICDD